MHAVLQFKMYNIIPGVCIHLCFRTQSDVSVPESQTDIQAPCKATNKEEFYSRVESYSISFYTDYKASRASQLQYFISNKEQS